MILSANVVIENSPRFEPAAGAPVRSRAMMAAALGLLAIFTIADIFSKGVVVSILYAVPLVLLARAGYAHKLRWVAAALVVIVYAVFFGKWAMYAPATVGFFNFGLVNRTFVVVAICMLEMLLRLRVSTEYMRGDFELSESLRHEEDETDETLAVLLGVGLTALIALADFLSPANYNLAILYMVPLFLCAWTRSRRLLWGMLAVSLALSVIGFYCGPPPAAAAHMSYMIVNRILAGLVLTLLAVLLHFQIGDCVVGSRCSDSRSQSGNPA